MLISTRYYMYNNVEYNNNNNKNKNKIKINSS